MAKTVQPKPASFCRAAKQKFPQQDSIADDLA
jgi:hypothetical protein